MRSLGLQRGAVIRLLCSPSDGGHAPCLRVAVEPAGAAPSCSSLPATKRCPEPAQAQAAAAQLHDAPAPNPAAAAACSLGVLCWARESAVAAAATPSAGAPLAAEPAPAAFSQSPRQLRPVSGGSPESPAVQPLAAAGAVETAKHAGSPEKEGSLAPTLSYDQSPEPGRGLLQTDSVTSALAQALGAPEVSESELALMRYYAVGLSLRGL